MNEVSLVFPKIFKPLDRAYRYKVMYGGRGSAKSWTVASKLILRGVEKPVRILCTRELQKSIKQSVHKLLSDRISAMGLNAFYKITDTSIKGINGTEFIFMGVKHNTYEIKSTEGVDICWIEEAESLTENSWDIIDPTIRKDGSEIWVTYNTRFKFDHLHKMFVIDTPPPGAWVKLVNHQDNQFFPSVLKTQMETMKAKDYEKYLNVWEGQLKQLAQGAIFGKQIIEVKKTNRLTYIPIQKNCEVDTFSDLGKKDQTAFWLMQRVGMEYRFIDYFEGRLEEVEYYTKFLKDMDYNYGTHYMPHDADHDRLGMSRNIKEQFEDGGIKPIEIVPVISQKTTAIQMTRDIFANCWFHLGKDDKMPDSECEGYLDWLPDDMNTRAKRTERGFEALCNYRYKYNDDDKVFQQKPNHDWASNGADAFQQFAQGYDANRNDWGGELNYRTGNIA
jgi:phage terminase large subunit